MDNQYKKALIKKHSPRSPLLKNSLLAFFFGGLICVVGELILQALLFFSVEKKTASVTVTLILIFIAATLTAL